jgi:hypothetical protein
MSVRLRTATVLTALIAAGLPAAGAAASPVSADNSRWPAELTENTRLFVNPYRSYLVQTVDGRKTLVLSTGLASCYFMTQDGMRQYPC